MSLRVPDNFYPDCPANMGDGRQFTDWRSATVREHYNKNLNKFSRDDELRTFYQQNGTGIIDVTWKFLKQNAQCFPNKCVHFNPTRSSNELDAHEMRNYNMIGSGKAHPSVGVCNVYKDYRSSVCKN